MRTLIFVSIVVLFSTFVSCSSVEDPVEFYHSPNIVTNNIHDASAPHSMDVMMRAYNHVKANSTRGSNIEIESIAPTHRYVKFSPTNRHQVDALNDHYTLYNFPLDEVPKVRANEGYDAISEDGCVYAMVEYNKILPDSISYVELGVYHNPYATEDLDNELAEEVSNVAYAISRFGDATKANELTPWIPTGTIRVWDDLTNDYIPLAGVQVNILHSQISVPYVVETDDEGCFRGPILFSNDVSYVIQWKGDDWAIKYDDISPAMTVSYASRLPLDLVIPKSFLSSYYAATIYRAATFYWNMARYCTPPTMSETVRITCHDAYSSESNALGVFYPYDRGSDEPIIEVWCKYHTSQRIISTTLHELAHAVHYTAAGHTNYHNTSRIIRDSWARYIQSIFVDQLYNYLSASTNVDYSLLLHDEVLSFCYGYECFTEYSPDEYNIQGWYYRVQNTQNRYSPIFIDITDGLNQREWFNSSLYPNDKIRVSGGIQLIESLVFNNSSLAEIKSDLIQHISELNLNIPTQDVNDLFEMYEQIENEEIYNY